MKRRAISPVIATVILIAITLIAAIAIAGFVFGLFPGFTASAQVTQGTSTISASGIGGGTLGLTGTCTGGGSPPSSGSYIGLSNTGTGSTTVTSVSLILGGTTYPVGTLLSCVATPVAASQTIYLVITGHTGAPLSAGSTFGGTVTLANSGQVPLSGVLAT